MVRYLPRYVSGTLVMAQQEPVISHLIGGGYRKLGEEEGRGGGLALPYDSRTVKQSLGQRCRIQLS